MPPIIPTTFRLGELFCGPGGLGLAAKRARVTAPDGTEYKIDHAWANDYDKDTCETYRRNLCPESPHSVVCKDVREFTPEEAGRISDIDGLAFGFPCNDYSLVGEQKGMDGAYGPLYQMGVRMLKELRPLFFLAENVGGIRSANEGKSFERILNELYGAGYSVYPHLYKFEHYGVPQARHRIIIVGIRVDQNVLFNIPDALLPGEPGRRTARQALEVPPIPEWATNQEHTSHSAQAVARLKHIKPGQNAWDADLPAHLRLNVAGATMSQIYKRLDPDKPAYTITGSGGGGTHVYHWQEDRALTNRERARLQTFPDTYEFAGSKESVRKQIGMAVPPDGAQIIFEAILKTFAGVPYRKCYANIHAQVYYPNAFDTKDAREQLELALWERQNNYALAD